MCVDILSKLDSWDYLALVMLVLSLWLILGGAGKLKAANPEQVDASKLKKRAYGAAAAAAVYLACRYFA